MKHLKIFEMFDIKYDSVQDKKIRQMSINDLAEKHSEDKVLYLKSQPSTEELHKDLKSLNIDFESLNAKQEAKNYTVGEMKHHFNLYPNGPSITTEQFTTFVPTENIINKFKTVGWKEVYNKHQNSSFGGYSIVYMQKGKFLLYTLISDNEKSNSGLSTIETLHKVISK